MRFSVHTPVSGSMEVREVLVATPVSATLRFHPTRWHLQRAVTGRASKASRCLRRHLNLASVCHPLFVRRRRHRLRRRRAWRSWLLPLWKELITLTPDALISFPKKWNPFVVEFCCSQMARYARFSRQHGDLRLGSRLIDEAYARSLGRATVHRA